MTSRQPPAEDPIGHLNRACTAVGDLVAAVKPGQWPDPTPCTEWDVSQLVDHLITGNRRFAALLRDHPQAEPAGTERGDDRAAAYRSSAAALRTAFSAPGALDRTYQSPIGPAPGLALVQLRIAEQLLHGWDLARATGQHPDLPEDLSGAALARARAQLGDATREGLPFAAPQPVAADASAIDQLAAFFGRRV
ncbi:MAG: TIGR03086 family metal-binding protein [Actinomycetota bacterium]|nr:TIGR03086 family metal-binding protein [Actinomycetota bacterium]